ncbi:MAG: hypothetical protein COA33_014635 [Fluviicola sp.]|nr:hypothetical protein [Fluviicola sp.]
MILRGIAAALFMLLSISSIAQDWSLDNYQYGKLYKGYIIDNEGTRIDGYIKYRNRWVMQNEVIFYKVDNLESPKKKYMTSNLSEYKVADKLYHVIPFSGKVGIQMRANLVTNAEGCIKEYVWYDRASSYNKLKKRPGESDEDFGTRKFPSTKVYFKSTDGMGVTKAFFKDDFAKKMAKYLALNKVLAKKVKTKKPGYTKLLDIAKIFKEYNKECGQ